MKQISYETPPRGLDEEVSSYLRRMFVQINMALAQVNSLNPITVLPEKPQNGDMAYFGTTIGATITSVGFWGYEAGAWVKL